jgi:hypothetical protein
MSGAWGRGVLELPGTASEVTELRALFGDAFRRPGGRYVRLATHGSFAREDQPSAVAPAQRAASSRGGG